MWVPAAHSKMWERDVLFPPGKAERESCEQKGLWAMLGFRAGLRRGLSEAPRAEPPRPLPAQLHRSL